MVWTTCPPAGAYDAAEAMVAASKQSRIGARLMGNLKQFPSIATFDVKVKPGQPFPIEIIPNVSTRVTDPDKRDLALSNARSFLTDSADIRKIDYEPCETGIRFKSLEDINSMLDVLETCTDGPLAFIGTRLGTSPSH